MVKPCPRGRPACCKADASCGSPFRYLLHGALPPAHMALSLVLCLMPKISVITPCYNAQAYIQRTIESVIAQSFTDWEMVIIDDGSRDQTAEHVGRMAEKDPRIRIIRQENGGVCRAR